MGWIGAAICAVAWMMFNSARSDDIDQWTPKYSRRQEINQEAKSLEAEANKLMQLRSAIKADIDDKTSWGSIINSGARAFFDGMTFGAFADEGMFTESKKIERWGNEVAQKDAARIERMRQIQAAFATLQEEDKTLAQALTQVASQYKYHNRVRSWAAIACAVAIIFALVKSKSEKTAAVVAATKATQVSSG